VSGAPATTPPGHRASRRAVVVAVVLAVALVGVGVLLAVLSGPGRLLPDTLAGLPAVDGRDGTLAALERSLRDEESVAEVQGQVYDDDTLRTAVLVVLPSEPLTDEAAAALVSGVLETAGEDEEEPTSRTSADGSALLACAGEGRQTCVTVEADRAVVAVTRGFEGDPLDWAELVRAEVVAHPADG
jgi:hypothetical protein